MELVTSLFHERSVDALGTHLIRGAMTEFVQMVIRVVDELYLRKTNNGEVPAKNRSDKRRCAMNADGAVQHSPKSSEREIVYVVSGCTDVRRVYSTRQKAEEFLNHARNIYLVSEFEIDGGPALNR